MQAPFSENESVEFEVKPRTPRLPGALVRAAIVGVIVLAVVGLAAASRSGSMASTGDALARVMPSNVVVYVSVSVRPDQQPNFDVVAEAWRGSREARQIEDALNSAVTVAGYDWQADLLLWLGDRVAVGVVDLGAFVPPADPNGSETGYYRNPFLIVAAQTRDRARSDAFLAQFRSRRESELSGDSAIFDEVYRGVSIVYVANDRPYAPYGEAYATIDDVVVFAPGGRDDLKRAIDAALDGANLGAGDQFQETMRALPAASVLTVYGDYAGYFELVQTMLGARLGLDSRPGSDPTGPLGEQMAQTRQMMQAMGGLGAAMTYEPGGVRFDFAMQAFPERLPEDLRRLAGLSSVAAPGRVFDAIPATAIAAFNMTSPSAGWSALIDSAGWLDAALGAHAAGGGTASARLAQLEKLAGIDLKADLLDLLDAEAGVVVLPGTRAEGSGPDLAVMLDASDPKRAVDSLDRLVDALALAAPDGDLQRQPLSGLPYTVLADRAGRAFLAYGVIGGRLVVGTSTAALMSIQQAGQDKLSADPAFAAAAAALPGDRAATGFVSMDRLRDLMASAFGGAGRCEVCNFLQPVKWISFASEVFDASAHLQRGVAHIALEPAGR